MSEEPRVVITETEVRIRRAPRYATFLTLGGALGAIATLALTMSQKADPHVGYLALFGYFLLFGLPAGVLLGALVAIVLDRVFQRSTRAVTAEVTHVEDLGQP